MQLTVANERTRVDAIDENAGEDKAVQVVGGVGKVMQALPVRQDFIQVQNPPTHEDPDTERQSLGFLHVFVDFFPHVTAPRALAGAAFVHLPVRRSTLS